MVLGAQTRNKNVRKPSGDYSKTTKTALAPKRVLTPPTAAVRAAGTPLTPTPAAVIPITGTPFLSPDASSATPNSTSAKSPSQPKKSKTPIENAQECLQTAFDHLTKVYQEWHNEREHDSSKTTVEMPFNVFEAIGVGVQDALTHLKKHTTHSDELEERFAHLEKTLKEAIASTTPKTYAQAAAAAPSPERNRISEIQQRNLERKVQKRREDAKLEVTLTMQEADLDSKEQLAQQPHTEITAKL
jgi:hypothetical protein